MLLLSLMIKWILLTAFNQTPSLCDYVYINEVVTFGAAVANCSNLGMELALATTQQKYQELIAYMNNITVDIEGAWIGLKWNSSVNSNQWLNGELLSTADWDSGEPATSDDCVVMQSGNYTWRTDNCTVVRTGICENTDKAPRFELYSMADFSTTNKQCIDDGKRLPIVRTVEDRMDLKQFIINNNIDTDIYLGISKSLNGKFQWMHGEDVDFYTWKYKGSTYNNLHVHATGLHYTGINIRPYICGTTARSITVYPDVMFTRLNTTVDILAPPVQERDVTIQPQCAMLCYTSVQCYYFMFEKHHCALYGNITYTPQSRGIVLWSKSDVL